MSQLRFVPALHLHVPVGLTEKDRRQAYERWIAPIIGALRDRPHLRFSLHVSGYLMRWLGMRAPKAVSVLEDLVQKRRVELLAGGWADPFLSGLPEHDALSQVQLQARLAEARVGKRPSGAYLAEGVWDPVLPELLHDAGLDYAFVAGETLLAAGVRPSQLHGWYQTERNGAVLKVLPTDPQLDGTIGPHRHEAAISVLERRRAMGMSFVHWVGSAERIAQSMPRDAFRPWLKGFLDALDRNSHWLRTAHPSELLQKQPCQGRVYLPSWIPAHLAQAVTGVSESELTRSSDGRRRPFTRAGTWQALLMRYEEANRIHKRMMQTSGEVQRLRLRLEQHGTDEVRAKALEHAALALYRAQGNAALWPSARGGLYEAALRNGCYANLCEAESLVARTLGEAARLRSFRADLDCDGFEELLVRTPHFGAVLTPTQGGSMVELGSWTLPGNVLDSMTRRDEPWHQPLHEYSKLPSLVVEEDETDDPTNTYEVDLSEEEEDEDDDATDLGTSYHMEDLAGRLCLDRATRASFVDRFLGPQTTLNNLVNGGFPEQGDFHDGVYTLVRAEAEGPRRYGVWMTREGRIDQSGEERLVQVRKRYTFLRDRPAVQVEYDIVNRTQKPVDSVFAVEVNLGASSSVGRGPRLVVDGCEEIPVLTAKCLEDVEQVHLADPSRKLRIVLRSLDEPGRLWTYPVTVVRNRRNQLEEAYQGVCLMLSWPVQLWGEEKRKVALELAVEMDSRIRASR
jgi:hypothetical protein